MKLKTNKLLLTSVIIIGFTILIATFWEAFGYGSEESIFLTFPILISFGINIAGLIFGIGERKKNKPIAMVGITGHSLLIITFFVFVAYALSTPIS